MTEQTTRTLADINRSCKTHQKELQKAEKEREAWLRYRSSSNVDDFIMYVGGDISGAISEHECAKLCNYSWTARTMIACINFVVNNGINSFHVWHCGVPVLNSYWVEKIKEI